MQECAFLCSTPNIQFSYILIIMYLSYDVVSVSGVQSKRHWVKFPLSLLNCAVLSDSVWPHGPQHNQPPCRSPNPRVYSNSCPLSQRCHPTISSSVNPFSCPLSFPASGSFQRSQFFASGGQSIGSCSFSINASNEYSRLISYRMDWLDLLAVQGTLKSLLQHHSSKASIL